jgi:hypothetical protein
MCLIAISSRQPKRMFVVQVIKAPTIITLASPPRSRMNEGHRKTLPDAFLSVRMDGPQIIANTWSCFAVTIDPKTGKTLSCAFTK